MQAALPLLRRHLAASWRYRWPGLAVAWTLCVLGWIGVALIPNRYESSARLFVDADAVLTPLLKGIAVDSQPTTQVEMLQRTLLSRPNLEKLISKTDLGLTAGGAAGREQLVNRLATDIKVVSQTKNLFTISYRNHRPRLAYDVVQTLIAIFLENAAASNRSDMDNARNFLDGQIQSYERQLQLAERRRAEFRSKYVDLLPTDTNGGVSHLEQARMNVQNLEGALQDATQRRDLLAREFKETPQSLVTDPGSVAGGGGSPLADAQRVLAELRLRYTEQHPDVIAARERVEQLRHGGGGGGRASVSGARSAPNPLYDDLKVRLVDAETLVASLRRQIVAAKQERERLEEIARTEPGLQADYQNIDRDYEVLRKNYEELLARRESQKISAAADVHSDKVKLQIIDPPEVPRLAVWPNRLILLPVVLGIGLAGGCAFVFLLMQLNRSFYTIDDLRDLGLPVLGGISLLAGSRPIRHASSVIAFGFAVLLLVALFGGLLSLQLHAQAVA